MAVNGRGHLIRQRQFSDRGLHPSLKLGGQAPGINADYFWHTAVAGNAAVQCNVNTGYTGMGEAVTVPTIPGRQYTASFYCQQSQANTLGLTVRDQSWADYFSRVVSSGWGSAPVAGAWTTTGGSASDYAVAAQIATITQTSVNVVRGTQLVSAIHSVSQAVTFSTAVLATGSWISVGLWARYTDASNYYRATARLNSDQTITVVIIARVAGVETTVGSVTSALTHAVNTQYRLRFVVSGNTVQTRLWLASSLEPSTWDINTTDNSLTAAGTIGCYSHLNTGNTNTNPVISFSAYGALNAVQVGTTTGNPLTWVRLQVTFTATNTTHLIAAQTLNFAVSGWVRIDNVQVEPGASASAFTASGPLVKAAFTGFVERWPATWDPDSMGFLGLTSTPVVGPFGLLNRVQLDTEYANAVNMLSPAYYYHLHEPPTATAFGDFSGNGGPPLKRFDAVDGPAATFNPGVANNIIGDPQGLALQNFSASISGSTASPIVTGPTNSSFTIGGSGSSTVSVTAAIWIAHSGDFVGAGGSNAALVLVQNFITNTNEMLILNGGNVPPDKISLGSIVGGVGTSVVATDSWGDGLPHLYVCGTTISTTGVTVTLYVDGVLIGTNTAAGSPATPWSANVLSVGGYVYANNHLGNPGWPNGVYSHVALWNRALTATEVAGLHSAGAGYAGERSGTRIARYLAETWLGATLLDVGDSVMGPSDLVEDTITLGACQAVATTENGDFYETGSGALAFQSRSSRYLALTSQYTLGENTAGGELPYLGDIEFDYDPTFIYNDVEITNFDGILVAAANDVSQRRYGVGTLSYSINVNNDNEAIDAANWQLATHDAPALRVNAITLDPASNPSLWPFVLLVEVGMRITVVRRPKAGNAGAGITMTMSAFVENVSHHDIDFAAGTWLTTLLVSPLPALTPFIFDNATYGLFDSGVFGY